MTAGAVSAAVIAGIGSVILLVAAPASAAPAGSGSVEDTVKSLEASGYKVIVNKLGSAPLSGCTVSAIRPGRDITEMRRNLRDRTLERVLYKTVYLDVAC